MRKNYILDANILIHDPNSILQFADNTIIIPISVISEIDQFKKEMTARGYNARAVVRALDSLRDGHSLATGIELADGGHLRVHCEPEDLVGNGEPDADTAILRVAQKLRETEPHTPVVIVTKDINLRIRADAAGFRAEDYETDHVNPAELYTGQTDLVVSDEQLAAFKHKGLLEPLPSAGKFVPNEYVLLRTDDGGRGSALARVDTECCKLIALRESRDGLCGIKPRNKEQYFTFDALLDPHVQLVTIMGKAGTGKTLLAVAAALHLTVKKKKYRSMLIARPIFPMGRDLGFLPGDVSQKLDPWMKPVADTIEFIFDSGGPIRNIPDSDALLRTGLVEIQPLTYIRGRSISNRFVVIDEAQNLTPLEVKTVITRIGQDAKIVLTGDPYQIDNPYVDATSNGFAYLVNRFRSQSIAAHIELRKGERSALSELAANLL
jgi:PhoH-like ATPase